MPRKLLTLEGTSVALLAVACLEPRTKVELLECASGRDAELLQVGLETARNAVDRLFNLGLLARQRLKGRQPGRVYGYTLTPAGEDMLNRVWKERAQRSQQGAA
ncbi:hypothetical protein [Deinococcus multiflagellatus]|uniref:Transcriptional regulator n=1 Tax=Deinococcus multiflagellatus TaxID=1656887 RepID=A0ABW1ZG29_9DEIO|nr:hypothetical protein [Deinococcus multiflagellatus]MBZ9712209.1 hypothetical protein [Deinococcus multiflagellatus]